MTVQLDEDLIYRTRRRGRKLTPDERIAINLFNRKGVRVIVIARAFDVSKNTIYYNVLNEPDQADALIKRLGGVDKALKKFATDEQIEAINRENQAEADARAVALTSRRTAA